MNDRERFLATMRFESADRLPFREQMLFWPETWQRWQGEGLPSGAHKVRHFGFDRFETLPIDFNPLPAFELKVLEEDESMRIVRDGTGVVKQEFKQGSAMPHYIDFPIKSREDFLAFKERLNADDPGRYPPDWEERVRELRGRDYPVMLMSRGLFAFLRDFMDFQQMCMAFLEAPEWVEEMMEFHTDFLMRYWERALYELEVDMIYLGEDMAYCAGPMVSPEQLRHFMLPRYRRLADFFRARGVDVRIVDSDGDIRSLIPLFLEGGMTGVLPLERRAGNDPVGLRKAYPRLQMIGGVDKAWLAEGGDTMRRKVTELVETLGPLGGFIPSCDHSVPPGVSLDNYRDYLELLRELGEKHAPVARPVSAS